MSRQLERALAGLGGVADVQDLVLHVESAQRRGFGMRAVMRQGSRGDAVRAKQEGLEPGGEVARVVRAFLVVRPGRPARLAATGGRRVHDVAQRLGPLVERGDVVVVLVEEIAHLFMRLPRGRREFAGAVAERGRQ